MKQIEIRRHSVRKEGRSLSKEGWQLARKVAQSLAGNYDLALCSPKTRCRETMEAFGIKGYTEDPAFLPLETAQMELHKKKIVQIARKRRCSSFAACFSIPDVVDALRKQGQDLLDVLRRVARELPEEGKALIVSHGGRIEPAALLGMDRFDLDAMGGELAPCEGVLFRFDGQKLADVTVLRV